MKHIKKFENYDPMGSWDPNHPSNQSKKSYSEIVSDIKPLFKGIENDITFNQYPKKVGAGFTVTYNKENDKTIIRITNQNDRPGGLSWGEFTWKEIKEYISKLIDYVNKEKLSIDFFNEEQSYSFKRGLKLDINDIGDYNRFEKLKIVIE